MGGISSITAPSDAPDLRGRAVEKEGQQPQQPQQLYDGQDLGPNYEKLKEVDPDLVAAARHRRSPIAYRAEKRSAFRHLSDCATG